MDYFFLSVAAVCVTALVAFRMYLSAKPACTRKEYEALVAEQTKLAGRVDKLAFNSVGRVK